jgi:KaiC/GvpD/RAD55 family RecA-like ATPase
MGVRSTNISELDAFLGGGIRHSSIALLWAHPGVDNAPFAYHIMMEALNEGDSCIFLASSKDPYVVVSEMRRHGWDPSEYLKAGRLVFVDAHSGLVFSESPEKFYVEDPRSAKSITRTLRRALESTGNEHTVVVYDSVSGLIDHCGEGSILEFAVWRNLFKENNATGVFMFTEWPYEDSVLDMLALFSDAVIKLKAVEEKIMVKEYFTVSKTGLADEVTGEACVPFQVSPAEGIKVLGAWKP